MKKILLMFLIAGWGVTLQAQKPEKGKASKSATPPATYANVGYGAHSRQVLDFWQADVEGPAPLVIFIHGGGFVGGSYKKIKGSIIKECFDAGVHFASVEYRLLQDATWPAPQADTVRAIQFIRSKAAEWNIDKTKIAAYGISAGATLATYVAFHDDFADSRSQDPVACESSRLAAVGSALGQSTIDLDWWAANIPGYDESITAMYSLSTLGQTKEQIKELSRTLSPITYITPDDPPAFLSYRMSPDAPVPTSPKQVRNWVIHHVSFGVALKEKLKANKVEVYLQYPGVELPFDNEMDFLMHHLKALK